MTPPVLPFHAGGCADVECRQEQKSEAEIVLWQQDSRQTDDKNKQDNRDRSRVAAGEDYEVQYLAEQSGITPEQARQLIRRYGNDRAKLMDEAKLMRGN